MNNRLTIVPEDGTIIVDDVGITEIDQQYLSWIPDNVHAFHWYPEFKTGEIEYKHQQQGHMDETLRTQRQMASAEIYVKLSKRVTKSQFVKITSAL